MVSPKHSTVFETFSDYVYLHSLVLLLDVWPAPILSCSTGSSVLQPLTISSCGQLLSVFGHQWLSVALPASTTWKITLHLPWVGCWVSPFNLLLSFEGLILVKDSSRCFVRTAVRNMLLETSTPSNNVFSSYSCWHYYM